MIGNPGEDKPIDKKFLGEFETKDSTSIAEAIKRACTIGGDCGKKPEQLLERCKENKKTDCDTLIREGVEKFCKDNSSASACWWLTTTTTTSSHLPFIIGGAVAAVVLLAVGIALFIYCRKKKKKSVGKGQSVTGATNGSKTATGATNTGTPTIEAPPATQTGSRY
ncbi:hypothetical protein GCK72_004515 [Caenorhabditis remanei]|uniref:Uncharacterized protein n=1 Tax=Caenorhabditis remanei TaxID=31234 RepID=A0A6A5HCL4_CAERE|nr:hypothetical protein GCK72_004515 [Caenorhabditis remanei]KAF1764566.1 hypothetical protein GCK72_004515 [Caenorhabditis remanei]